LVNSELDFPTGTQFGDKQVGLIIFGSVRFLSKKVTKPKFFFFEKKTETEPKPGQTDRFRFGFLGKKPV
jgi:hypothetical protein